MNEYDNIIQSYTEAGPALATSAIGADPERATRALQLSRATGVPPLAVHEDLDRFEEDHKANLTANIVRGNSQISSYIRGNALADHVSNDDYGNLDESSRAFTDALNSHPIWGKGIPKQYIAEPLMEGLKGAIYGAAEGFTQEPFKVPENYSALSKGAYDFLGIPLRGLNAVAGGFMGGAGGLARQATIALGGDENQAARAEREAKGIVESEMGRGGSGLQHADHAIGQVVRQNEALAVAKPWLDAGVDVPRGVHPLIDEIKVKTNDAWVDKIQTALDQAQNSLTKERDPELFKNFAQQHFEDAQMGISGDRVAALYGDKLPEPGDGLLGWVPGIAEKLEAARTFGEDVHVPLADWVTYMDPGLARELKDDIRAWPGGITKNEAALKDVAAPAIGANKEMTPVKEAVPEIEPITLDQRLDAYREEYHNMLEDATFDERGFRQSGLRDALATVSSSFGVSGDRGREALDLAIRHDRPDIAEALVQRAERLAQKSDTTPGVPETSPKYNEIKKNLERLKKEAEDYAAELREKLNESKLKNDTLIDGALPQTRAAAGLEPMFAIGDRRLELKKQPELKNPNEGRDPRELVEELGLNWDDLSTYEKHVYTDRTLPYNNPQHFYNFHDENGNAVGQLVIHPDPESKQLYVDWVGGVGKFGPRSFGPGLIRDIKRQLKEIYPEYESITGHRVSGARYNKSIVNAEAARLAAEDGLDLVTLPAHIADKYYEHAEATVKNPTDHPVVKLALSDAFEMSKEYTDLRNILDTAPTKFGDVTADIKPTELYSKHEQAFLQAGQEELNRITGKTAKLILASNIRYEGIDDIRGVYHKMPGEVAKIIISALDFDKGGILRHEAIHHLYREGFFKPEEWNALIEASKTEGWRERYGIDARYEHLNELGLHEEAIAEAFRDWAKTREQQPHNPVTTVFQKIWDLMQRIKDRVAEILGREPTFNELFEQAYSGELAQRELAERSREKIQTDLGENVPGALFSVAEEPTKKGFIAYHGSPHEFDKFDASKIGTGEGAQAYGHGLYFAEKKGIAEHYRDSVSKSRAAEDEIWIGGKPFNPDDPIHQAAGRLHEYDYNRNQTIYFLDGLIDDFEKSLSNKKDHWLAVTKQAREILASGVELPKVTEHSPGSLYQVRIDADPAHFLDWDKPLSEQKWIWDKLPEDLKAAIDDAMDARGHNPMSEVLEEYTGKDLYRALTQHEIHESIPAELPGSSWYEGNTTEKIHTAKFFESLGVEGIQYLDAGSRRKGDGSRNYVVFNDKNVEITHKNGKPVNEPPPFAKGESPQEQQLKAEAAGLDAKSFKKIQDLIQKRYQEDIAAAVKRAEQEQRTIQSKEWKEAAREIRKESEADVRARPDVQADLLIGSGELGGKKLERNRYELRSEDLSPEQKAALPRHYYAKDGVPVDVMANLFGYSDGNHLIEALAEVNKGKEGRSAQENLKRLIDEETNRRMEEKYGKLQQNIMLDAMDQALSETNLQILSEEWQGAAMAAGVKVVDKNIAKEEALRMFGGMKLSDVNVERLLGIMGKIGRDTERLLIAGKNAEALVQMQRKYQTALIAAEARKLQKEQATFDRTYNQMRKREIKSMEPEYTDMVHQIYQLIDKPVQRSIQDLQESIARNEYKNLADFIEKKQLAMRVVDAWEPLIEGNWKKSFNDLTVDEFRGVNGTIKNLVHNGKEERKIYKAGEAADFAELKGEFIQSIVDAAHGDFAKLNKGKYAKLPEQYFVQHIQMETFLNRLDGYDPNGVWFQYVYRDLADGAAQVDIWRKHFSNRLKDVPQPKNLHRTLDNPLFKDQDTGLGLPFTRRNLIAVMLNTGNSTNLKKMAEGYKLKSDDVMSWVHQHATKAEWDYVQHIWDVFKEIKDKSDTMYRSLSGVAPENIEIRPIDTPHGQYKGGYYPLIREPNQVGEGSGKVFGRDALLQENFVSAMPPAGYTKKRTGAIYPLSLEPDMMTNQMSQMLHDIGMRPALINASKIFMNKEIQSKIRAHFGDAWKDELKDYLVGVANAQNYMPQNQKAIMELAEFARQNVISTVIGFNPGTVMKHGPTALGLSIKEVGFTSFVSAAREAKIFRNVLAEVAPESYRSAVRSLLMINDATSNKTWNFIMENSLELQRRVRNWQETLFGATAGLQPFDKYATFRSNVMQLASHPVALSDMLSAVPTWLAKYKEAQAAGKDHGESVTLGDRAVRRAHGSTASTSRTSFQRNYNPYLTSVYNFWSDILNRQVETIWRAGDEAKLTNGNPVQKGLATVPILAGGLLAYSIWPAIVESHVSPHPHGDDESFVWRALKQFAFTEMGGWVGIRDAATAFAFARDPHYGFTGTAWQGLTNLPRDLLRKEPLNKERVGKLIQDGAALMGTLTGSFPLQIGKSARYVYGVKSGQENPQNVWQWLVGLRFGTNDKHSRSFEEYWKGKH